MLIIAIVVKIMIMMILITIPIIRKKEKGDHKHGLKLSKPKLKRMIIHPYSILPLPLPSNPPYHATSFESPKI